VPQAGGGFGLGVAAEQHDARRLVEATGLREEGRCLRELPAELGRAGLRENARAAPEVSSEDAHEMIS
jgi:hypothetical protein